MPRRKYFILIFSVLSINAYAFMGLSAQRLGHGTATKILSLFVGEAGMGSLDNQGTLSRLDLPYAGVFDSSGLLWFTDFQGNLIRTYNPTTKAVTTVAGVRSQNFGSNVDATGVNARLYRPWGIDYNSTMGKFVFADSYNDTIRAISPSGAVTTIAGIAGTPGFGNGTGNGAAFSAPSGIAVDLSGNMYVADANNNQIRKITTAGVVTTFAGSTSSGSGNGTGTAATFSFPSGIVIDAAGANLYVADQSNQLIRQITVPGGVVTTLAGTAGSTGSTNGTGTGAKFNFPTGLTIDKPNGILYVMDSGNNLIRRIIISTAVVTTTAGTGTYGNTDGVGTSASFANPTSGAVDASSNLYVFDTSNSTIRMITGASGSGVKTVTTVAGQAGLSGTANGTGSAAQFFTTYGLTVDGSSNLYVADTDNSMIRKVTSAGVVTTLAGQAGTAGSANGTGTAAQFNFPQGIVYSSTANAIFVADTGNYRIRKVTTAGVVTNYAGSGTNGSANGSLTAGSFGNLAQLGVDSSGNLYVPDIYNCTIRKITSSAISTLAGSPGSCGFTNATGSAASFNLPQGVAVDSSGNIFVADTGNNAIRKVTSAGVVTTFAGSTSGTAGFVDGTTTAARFNFPMNLVIDASNNIYVADSANFAIRKITSAGVVTTVVGNGAGANITGFLPSSIYFPYSVALGSGKLYIGVDGGVMNCTAP